MPLKQINQLKSFQSGQDGFNETIIADIAAPGDPKLAVFCCPFLYVPVYEPRTGTDREHGKKRWFPCEPTIYDPVQLSPTQFQWDVPICECGAGNIRYWNIIEFGAPPILQWSSLPHAGIECNAVTIVVEDARQIIPGPLPPGTAVVSTDNTENPPLRWFDSGALVAEPGAVKVEFNGFAGTGGGHRGGDLTLKIIFDITVIGETSVSFPPSPATANLSLTATTIKTTPGISIIGLNAGYDTAGDAGSVAGTITITYLPT